ncbi:heme biosynthesis HemY N-terminal domain-containing protein [Roseibium sediminicola]|uniref:Heme biosynthesis protein HemY n=1 Tax=Roseibium sediminicola TaxID=2933272 RepID=A0ABT0GTB7_9HYPH|nr:heme biosynthesis HemY N-terminal domain-containing protein [Roseibium sp. CAU 1639]MCK7612480.1 heme biosynthesis protein HemY [Roseibium sp. CAU 1639]
MIRVFVFFFLLFAIAAGFAWMADLPGTIQISWPVYENGEQVGTNIWEQSPTVVALVAAAFLAVFLGIVWAIRVVLKSPQIASRFFRRRRKDKGYNALSQGLIALGTGNAKLARRHALDADRLLADEPAAQLLLAQTAQLAGKDDEARQRFEAMLEDPATKALGLHGLFVEAERHREPVAARHYAEEAAKTSPGLEWAGKAVLGYQAVAHHWDEALKTLERNYAAKMLDKKTYRRQRAVILTALAQKLEDGEPERAYSLAKEAHGLALDLVPAAVITSRLATRRGDIRKASKVLEATWRLSPHPDLAETYAHVRTGDAAVDRLKRVKSLSAQRANTPEGAMAIARAAMEAREFDEARKQLKKVLQSEPTRKAFVLMAELEEAEHGDRGRMRDWLARAVSAPMDKIWMADGVISAEWQAVSPVTGKLDAFQWVTPDSLSDDDGAILEDSLFEAPALPAAGPATVTTVKETASSAGRDDEEPVVLEAEPVEPVAPEPAVAAKPAAAAPVGKQGYEGTTDDVKHSSPLKDLPDAAGEVSAPAKPEARTPEPDGTKAEATSADKPAPEPDGTADGKAAAKSGDADEAKAKSSDKDDMNRPIEFPLSRMPDDPGPEDEEEDKADKTPRPRFFN